MDTLFYNTNKGSPFKYNKDQLILFFESWFQEVRHVVDDQKVKVKRNVLAKAYVTEFVENLPKSIEGYLER